MIQPATRLGRALFRSPVFLKNRSRATPPAAPPKKSPPRSKAEFFRRYRRHEAPPTIAIRSFGKNPDYRHFISQRMLKFCLINLQEKLLLAKILYARNVSAADGAPKVVNGRYMLESPICRRSSLLDSRRVPGRIDRCRKPADEQGPIAIVAFETQENGQCNLWREE